MIPDDERERTIRFIAERRCENGGYCHYRLDEPGTADTFFALDTLRLLGIPGSVPSFLEHAAAGAECAVLAGVPHRFPEACREFIRRCRNANGGYSRSIFGGISTLENTWLAIRVLARLENACDTDGDTHD